MACLVRRPLQSGSLLFRMCRPAAGDGPSHPHANKYSRTAAPGAHTALRCALEGVTRVHAQLSLSVCTGLPLCRSGPALTLPAASCLLPQFLPACCLPLCNRIGMRAH
jgi:hypothetical protein